MGNTEFYGHIKGRLIGTRLTAGDYSFKPYHCVLSASYLLPKNARL
jgi:nucleoside-specific outer membrane channel protein Tsx